MLSPETVTSVFYSILLSYFVITFLESGIDKFSNPKENIDFFEKQFSNTLLEPIIKPLFWILAFEELIAGILFLGSIVGMWVFNYHIQQIACIFGLFVLLQLFFGQRIAKDYAGASGILPYVIMLTIMTILFAFS